MMISALYIGLLVVSVTDLAWGAGLFLKWGVISPNLLWMSFQPLPYNMSSVDVHVVVLLPVLCMVINELLCTSKEGHLEIGGVLRGLVLFIFVWFLYVLASPDVAYNDWGWTTILSPQSVSQIPKYLVFFMNDIVGRGLNTLAVLQTRAITTRANPSMPNPKTTQVTMKKRFLTIKPPAVVTGLSLASMVLLLGSAFSVAKAGPLYVENELAGCVVYLNSIGVLFASSSALLLTLAMIIYTRMARGNSCFVQRTASQISSIATFFIVSKIAVRSSIEMTFDIAGNMLIWLMASFSVALASLMLGSSSQPTGGAPENQDSALSSPGSDRS
jgi:hypothetical protein